MAFIPKYNKLSLQEIAYAPALMRQQHDEAVATEANLAEKLKFDYLSQDRDKLDPKLQDYNTKIDNISKELGTKGFSQDLKTKLIELQSQYSGDDMIRKVKKNYADAMSGWEDTKKSLQASRASGDEINKMRKAYFGDYKGAFDDENYYQEFNPGATSGIYDMTEDVKNMYTNIGETGKIVGKSGASIEKVPADMTKGIPEHYRMYDSTTGQWLDNLSQIDAVTQYAKTEYNPNNKSSDKGLYSKIMQRDPDYINNTIDAIGESMKSGKYGQLPQTRVSISMPSGSGSDKQTKGDETNPTYKDLNSKHTQYEDAEDDILQLSQTPETIEQAKKAKIGELSSKLGALPPSYMKKEVDRITKEVNDNYNPDVSNSKTNRVIAKYQTKYPKLFSTDIPPIEAAKQGAELEKAYSDVKTNLIGFKGDNSAKKFYLSLHGEKPIMDGKDAVDFTKVTDSYKDSGISWEAKAPLMDINGNVYFEDAKGKRYGVNPNALSTTMQSAKKLTQKVSEQITNPTLFDNGDTQLIPMDAKGADNSSLYLKVVNTGDPKNPASSYDVRNREIQIVSRKPYSRQLQVLETVPQGYLFQRLAQGIKSEAE